MQKINYKFNERGLVIELKNTLMVHMTNIMLLISTKQPMLLLIQVMVRVFVWVI